MEWFKEKKPAADIIAVAVESDRQQVEELIRKMRPPVRTAMATDEIREVFDGPPAYPTLVLADKTGRIVRVFYGAPPNLHSEIEKALKGLR